MRTTMRSFELCQQIKSLKGGIEHIDKLLKSCVRDGVPFFGHIEKWAYIVHDRDVKQSGEMKEPHIHLMVKLRSPYPVDMISRSFNVAPQFIERIKGRWSSALAYLTHKNAPSKYQYSLDDVVSNFDKEELQIIVNDETSLIKNPRKREIIRAILNGDFAEWNLHKFITGEEYTQWRKDIENAFRFYDAKHEMQNRVLDVVYIYGVAGSGKSSFAKCVFPDAYVSSQGKNPFDNYKGQPQIILDDARFGDKDWSIADLCKLLDNNTASLVGARYYNKNLHRCSAIVITSITPWSQFLKQKGEQFKEDAEQISRRVGTVLEIKKRGYLATKNALAVDVLVHRMNGRKSNKVYKKEIQFPDSRGVRITQVLADALGFDSDVVQESFSL